MLRRVYLDNFVKFSNPQTVEFTEDKSPYIFVGENGSGKSSFLEGIRRCLPLTVSTTRSSVFDKNKPGVYICKFATENCLSLTDCQFMFTGIISKFEESEQVYYKFISTKHEYVIEKHCDTCKSCDTGDCFQYNSSDKDAVQFFDDLETRPEYIVEKIVKGGITWEKAAENSLKQKLRALNDHVILTFPLRSIGPLQWSKSTRIAHASLKENYSEAGKRAEIIRYFLEHPDEFDLNEEQELFRDLTSAVDIDFQLNEDNIWVKAREGSMLPGMEYALLKLPEGILEAKHFSVLMSHKTFLTVILEEPDRGMHPQMIERMYAVIQKYSKKKMIILVTHNTCLINPFTITRLVIFKKMETDYTEIVLGTEVAKIDIPRETTIHPEEDDYSMKTLRILTHDHFADIIFARRILFCEGDSDFLFLTALKERIMKMSDGTKCVLRLKYQSKSEKEREDAVKKDLDTLQRVCVSLQIISMNGWNHAELMHRVCCILKLNCRYFICDKDAIITENESTLVLKGNNKWLGKPFEDIRNEFKSVSTEKWQEVRERLRKKCNVFIWRDGTIEDMIISLLRSAATETPAMHLSPYDYQVSWKKKRVKIDTLKALHVDLPFNRWKVRRLDREDKAQKLFLSPKVTQQNVMDSVEIILGLCDDSYDDLVQFIEFLLNMDVS